MTWEFWVTSTVVTATPGTGALSTVAAGLSRGIRTGLVTAPGGPVGIVPHSLSALSGAAALLAASPVAFDVMKWLGVAYLIYMGWGTWRQRSVLTARMAGLDAVCMAITLGVCAVYGRCAARLRRYVIGKPVVMRWMSRGFAVSFVVRAVMLGFTHR